MAMMVYGILGLSCVGSASPVVFIVACMIINNNFWKDEEGEGRTVGRDKQAEGTNRGRDEQAEGTIRERDLL